MTSKAKKRKREKMRRLRDDGWIVGTADEFVDSLCITEQQNKLLNSLSGNSPKTVKNISATLLVNLSIIEHMQDGYRTNKDARHGSRRSIATSPSCARISTRN